MSQAKFIIVWQGEGKYTHAVLSAGRGEGARDGSWKVFCHISLLLLTNKRTHSSACFLSASSKDRRPRPRPSKGADFEGRLQVLEGFIQRQSQLSGEILIYIHDRTNYLPYKTSLESEMIFLMTPPHESAVPPLVTR